MMTLSKARFGDDPSCRAGFLRHRRRVWTQGPSMWRAFALAVATKESTDKDSNVLHGRTAHESAVAIRKPAGAGNGYRFAKLLRPTQRTRILSSRLCSSQLNPRPGNSPSSLSFEKMHAGWRKPPASVGRRGFILWQPLVGQFDVLGEADIIMASRVRWRTVANIAPDSAVTVGQGRKALSVWRAFF